MNILVISVTTGEGHNSAAKALREGFISKGATCEVLDAYGYCSPALGKLLNDGYIFVSGKARSAFGRGYRLAEKRRGNSYEISTARIANMIFTKEIGDYINGFKPDFVVYTHPFAGIIVDLMKQRGILKTACAGIITDFTIHPYWEECLYTDYLITPSELLSFRAMEKGFREMQIKPFGIPIDKKFSDKLDKKEARRRLGLDENVNTVLLMSGSMGYGKLDRHIKLLDAMDAPFELQIICVCGNNAEEKRKIDKLKTHCRVLNFGFTHEIDLIMDAADCFVGKPGGLSTSEALAKRLPMIMINPIPGQEQRNVEFLLNCGAAMSASPSCTASELVYRFFTSEWLRNGLHAGIDAIRRPNSADDICSFVMNELACEESAQ